MRSSPADLCDVIHCHVEIFELLQTVEILELRYEIILEVKNLEVPAADRVLLRSHTGPSIAIHHPV